MRTCAYCDGEVVMPPENAFLERPYVCMGCHRSLSEKETIVRPFEIPKYDV